MGSKPQVLDRIQELAKVLHRSCPQGHHFALLIAREDGSNVYYTSSIEGGFEQFLALDLEGNIARLRDRKVNGDGK